MLQGQGRVSLVLRGQGSVAIRPAEVRVVVDLEPVAHAHVQRDERVGGAGEDDVDADVEAEDGGCEGDVTVVVLDPGWIRTGT